MEKISGVLFAGRSRRLVAILGGLAGAFFAAGVAAALVLGNWTVTFDGVTYDHVANTTTITYTVEGGGSGPAMSHITLGVCAAILPDEDALVDYDIQPPPDGTYTVIVGHDPTLGVRGLKFECVTCGEIQQNDETKTFSFTVEGIWAVDPNGTLGIKAGTNNLSGVIEGLDCDSIDLEITTQCADFTEPDPFYRSIVTNSNPVSANNVVVVDELPADVAYAGTFTSSGVAGMVSCSGDGANPETVTCTLDELLPGETWTLDIDVVDNTGGPVSVEHKVTVSADEVDAYTVDNEDVCTTHTPVTLAYVHAEPVGDGLSIRWMTSSEAGNIGFNVYAVTDDGVRRLNDELIPATSFDETAPAEYHFAAEGVSADAIIIEDVDRFGRARQHRGFEVGVEHGARVVAEAIDWAAVHAEDARLSARRDAAALAATSRRIADHVDARGAEVAGRSVSIAGRGDGDAVGRSMSIARRGDGDAVSSRGPKPRASAASAVTAVARFTVAEDGMVRVTHEALAAAGIDLGKVAIRDLAIVNRGQAVPVRFEARLGVFGRGASLEFYGEGIDSLYTDENVYDLLIDPARRREIGTYKSRSASKAPLTTVYTDTLVVDRNRAYFVSAPGDDPWFDLRMLTHRSPSSWSVPFDIDDPVPGTAATLRLELWGAVDWPLAPDHHVIGHVNGEELFDHTFDGLRAYTPEFRLPDGTLQPGANTLGLTLPGDTGADFDQVLFDSLELEYARRLVARDGRLSFEAAAERFLVTGLTGPGVSVHRLQDGSAPVRYTGVQTFLQPDGTYAAIFDGTAGAARYEVLSGPPGPPVSIEPVRGRVEIAPVATDYLIIAHPNFKDGLAPLVEHHAADGWRVKVVDVRDVYERHGHGIFDPEAIRAYAAEAVASGVRAVLLVGGDTSDYLNHAHPDAMSFIPTLYGPTDELVRYAPIDSAFVDVDDDGVPDAAIGRLPVRTTAELDTIVAKTLAYAAKPYGRTGIFTADIREPVVDFARDSEGFIDALPAGWSVERAYLDQIGVDAARARLIDRLNAGVALTSFAGHSSTSAWTFSGLFRSTDAAALTNAGRPTVVAQWGCWNTYFVSPSYNSLGHAFMLSGDRGAAAVLGASTLTKARSERLLGAEIMPRMTAPGATIGTAILEGKRALAVQNPHLADVLMGWTLLGDPLLRVD